MPITRRGNSWQAVIHFKKQRYRKTCSDYSEAEAWSLETMLKLKRGEEVKSVREIKKEEKAKAITWQQLRDNVVEQRWSTQKSSVTHCINSQSVVNMLGKDTPVSDTTQSEIDDLVVALKAYKTKSGKLGSRTTVNRKLSSLSVLVRYATKRGYITQDFDIPKLPEPEHRIRWIDENEEVELIKEMKKLDVPDLLDIVPLLIDTGLRLGELWRLTLRDVRSHSLTVWQAKSNKPRSVPLTKRAQEICNRRRKMFEKETDEFFPGWTNWRLTHYWNQARKRMGLIDDKQFVPHTCRHTFCSRLIQRGVSPVHVKELAGHSIITTTMRYAHLSQSDLERAITVLDGPGTVVAQVDQNPVGKISTTSNQQTIGIATMA